MEQAETAADEMPVHPAEGFFGLDIRLIVLLFLSALCLYMLVYVNTPSAEKKTRRLFNLCGIIFSFLPSVIACLLLFDAVRVVFGLQDTRLYLIPLALGIAVSGYGFVHAKKVYTKTYTLAVQGGKRELTAALIVCGHTHKGQFFPATYFTRWAYGDRGFYGHTQTGSTHSVVSSGAGYFQLPVRIGTNSEVVALHIRRG